MQQLSDIVAGAHGSTMVSTKEVSASERGMVLSSLSAPDTLANRRRARTQQVRKNIVAVPDPEMWSPPDFSDHRRTRIGASIVEQFVAGHDSSEVLRELVQNEFDGGGDRLTVVFGD